MNYETQIQVYETRVFKVVFPNNNNHYDTKFGGKVMEIMYEVAFMQLQDLPGNLL